MGNNTTGNFDVLLTVHLSIFISAITQLDVQIFVLYNKFISYLYTFRAYVFIIRRSKLHYTASGIIIPIGGRPVHRLREDSQPVRGTATYRYDDTRGCVMQFWPPDDEHMSSKHLEAWNKFIVKQKVCASGWLITDINILRCTVSECQKIGWDSLRKILFGS